MGILQRQTDVWMRQQPYLARISFFGREEGTGDSRSL